jgi:hypothetical protein
MLYEKAVFVDRLYNYSFIDAEFISFTIFVAFVIIFTVLSTSYLAYRISHYIFKPLRELNSKMRNILKEGMNRDLEDQKESSADITGLYEVF